MAGRKEIVCFMNLLRRYLLIFFALFFNAACLAQSTVEDKPEMAVGMRSNGKIYVVITIVLTILFILIGYLAIVDRKVSRLEKAHNK